MQQEERPPTPPPAADADADAATDDERDTLDVSADAGAEAGPGAAEITPEFEHPLFRLDAGGMVVPKEPGLVLHGAQAAQQQLELVEALVAHVQAVMQAELGFQEVRLPSPDAPATCPIFVSSNWDTAEKLLVVMQQSSGAQPGIWSRSTCLRFGLANGSMLPCLRSACELEFGVVVMNPTLNKVFVDAGDGSAPRKLAVESCGSPAEHVHTVWERFVARAAAANVFVLAFGRGGELVPGLLAEPGSQERVRSVAIIEGSHNAETPAEVAGFFASRVMHWHCAETPAYTVSAAAAPLGCVSLSAGDSNLSSSNAANTIPIVMPSVMRFMHEMGANAELTAPAFAELENALFGVAPPIARRADSRGDADGGSETNCYNCAKGFTLFDRRHHCRQCFRAVCNACSRDRLFLPNYSTAQRVCGPCVVAGPGGGGGGGGGGDSGGGAGRDHRLAVEDFELLKVVGKGAFGKVLLVRKRGSGEDAGGIFAMKILKKSFIVAKNQVEHTLSENRIMRDIEHPFLVRLRYSFQNAAKLYLVMDYYSGGSLYFHLKQRRRFSVPRARFYCAELLLGLSHLHSLKIVYRDLKLENVLLHSSGHLALTDFGLSKENVEADSATTFCGTAEYIAPELISARRYGPAVDYWALGILLFEMIHGQTPFYSRNRKTMFSNILHRDPQFPPSIPDAAQDLIAGLLFKDPARRLGSNGVEEVKAHPFFADIDWDALFAKQVEPPFRPDNDELSTEFVFPGHVEQVARDSIEEAPQDLQDPFGDFTYRGAASVLSA